MPIAKPFCGSASTLRNALNLICDGRPTHQRMSRKSSVMPRSNGGAIVMNDIGWVSANDHEEEQMRRLADPEYQKEQEKRWCEYFSPEQMQRRDEQRRREAFHSLLIFIFVLGLP